jgi:hypothetical protein
MVIGYQGQSALAIKLLSQLIQAARALLQWLEIEHDTQQAQQRQSGAMHRQQ